MYSINVQHNLLAFHLNFLPFLRCRRTFHLVRLKLSYLGNQFLMMTYSFCALNHSHLLISVHIVRITKYICNAKSCTLTVPEYLC